MLHTKKHIKHAAFRGVIVASLFLIGCSSGHQELVKIYEDAHNRHDIEKIMSLYNDDIRFEIVGSFTKTGKEQVYGLAEWDSVTNSQMSISNVISRNDTVFFKLQEGNDWFRLIGLEYEYYDPCWFIIKNGKISELRAEITEESRSEFNQAWPEVLQWLLAERQSDLSNLLNGNDFIYNAQTAQKWLVLLNDWREKQGTKPTE